MKLKFFNHALLAIAAAGSLASCQNEMDCPGPKDGVRPLTFCTKLPVGFTRAFADGNTADVLTCYVYDSTGKTFLTEAQGTISGGSGQVTVQLVGNENYKILFWAANSQVFDAKQPQSATMPYKINPETGELSVDYAQVNGNSDKYDAFYTVIDVTGGANATQEIDLRRAFAQVNVGTDDSELPVVKEAYKSVFNNYPLIYTEAAIYGVCNRVNLVANTAQSSDTTTLKVKREQMNAAATGAFSAENFPVAATPVNKYTSMAYVLASPIGSTVNVGFKAFNTDQPESEYTAPVQSMMIPSAPIKTNWRTNIYGSLLSSKSNFQVDIQPNIQGTEKDVIIANNITQLSNGISAAVAKGETAKVSLGADMADQVLTIPAATTPTVIDLETNGKAIPAIVTTENVTINIYENFPTSKPASKARRTRAAQALFTANNNSTINIYGGSYESDNMFATAGNGAIHVYGGSFKGVAKATLEGYVPEGKYVTDGDNGFLTITTTKPENVVTVTTVAELRAAIATANATPDTRIVISKDMTLQNDDDFQFSGNGTKLDINPGVTVNALVGDRPYTFTVLQNADLTIGGGGTLKGVHRLIEVFGTCNIQNCTITSNSSYDAPCASIYLTSTPNCSLNIKEGANISGRGNIINTAETYSQRNYPTVNIEGGTITSTENNENAEYAIIINSGTLNMSAGIINGARGCATVTHYATVNISGDARFNSTQSEGSTGYGLSINEGTNGSVTGGIFHCPLYAPIAIIENNKGSKFSSFNVTFTGGKYMSAHSFTGGAFFSLGNFIPTNGEDKLSNIPATGYKWNTTPDAEGYYSIVPVSTEPAAKRRR